MKRFAVIVLILLLVGSGVVGWQYRTDLDSARERLLAGSQIVITPCGTIEYAVAGLGWPVLAIHGAGGGYTQLAEFARELQAAGFQVIAMSRFGYLRTPMRADASPAAQADAHACLLNALGVKRAAVMGVSAGATSAMQFCIRHRERCSAGVLLVPAVYAEGRTTEDITPPSPFMQFVLDYVLMSDFVMWTIMNLAPGVLIQTALATPLAVYERAPPAEQERALRLIRDTFPVSLRREGIKNDAAVSLSLKRFPLEEIRAPTLLLSVEDDLYDTLAGARYTAQHIPHSRLVIYPSGGHVWLGHGDEVSREITSFLRRVTSDP